MGNLACPRPNQYSSPLHVHGAQRVSPTQKAKHDMTYPETLIYNGPSALVLSPPPFSRPLPSCVQNAHGVVRSYLPRQEQTQTKNKKQTSLTPTPRKMHTSV